MLKTNTLGALAAAAGALVAVGLVMLMVLVVDVQPAEATFAGKNGNIAYSSLDGTDFEIYTIPPTGGTPTRLTNNAVTDQNPSCSPDGTKIAFETLRGSNKEIYMMDAADRDGDGNGDNPTRLTNNAATDRYPDWGPLADVSPPRVTSTIPNATGVAPTTNVMATFSEEMLVSSINAKTFKLFKQGSTTKITAAVSYDAATDTAKVDPRDYLLSGVTYKAVVTTVAKDVAGNRLDQNTSLDGLQRKVWFFEID